MTLLAPLWLSLLVPWAVLWAWAGRQGDATTVPFLRLWPRQTATHGSRRRWPPWWAIPLLLAAGLAILAAAGPARVVPATRLTIVVGNGPAMTPARLGEALARLPIHSTTRLRVVPSVGDGFEQVGGVDVDRLPRSVLADEDALRGTARRVAREGGGAAVVVADHVVPGLPEGMAVVTPAVPLVNAGIEGFAVVTFAGGESGVRAQAMVRVLNHTDRTRATLRIGETIRAIDLPLSGTTRDYFIDLPVPGDTAVARLLDDAGRSFGDDVAADDFAYVAKSHAVPRVEPNGPLPAAVGRVLAVYAARRPPEPRGGVVTVGPTLADGPGVMIAGSFAMPTTRPATAILSIDTNHPVTRTADLRDLVNAPRTGGAPSDDGRGAWRVLARDGDDVLLAVRETPARQAWVGVDTTAVADSAAFVVLWADLLDWLGGGAATWANTSFRDGLTAIDVADASLAGGPGVYREDGRTVAVAMPPVRPGAVAGAETLPVAMAVETVPLASGVLLGAMTLMLAGLVLLSRKDARSRSRRNGLTGDPKPVRRERE